MRKFLRALTLSIVAVAWASCALRARAATEDVSPIVTVSALEQGYFGLYNLDFAGAQKDFETWETLHPDGPVGPVSEAAGFLFSEFNRLGVLEAQFYENDKAFAARPKVLPDPKVKEKFQAAIDRGEQLSSARLQKNPQDRDALFARTLAAGLQADYAALIERRNLASLRFTKEASASAEQLLVVCHDCYDGLLATGFSKYIIGSMAAPARWVLRLGGLPADKQSGLADLRTTAARGHYLAPFARILLAIAYVRDKNQTAALQILSGLRRDFPGNPLFPREIARLESTVHR